MALAKQPFWLDGGYDRESVEACPYHPMHRWWVFRLGDVLDCEWMGRDPDERMVDLPGLLRPALRPHRRRSSKAMTQPRQRRDR